MWALLIPLVIVSWLNGWFARGLYDQWRRPAIETPREPQPPRQVKVEGCTVEIPGDPVRP